MFNIYHVFLKNNEGAERPADAESCGTWFAPINSATTEANYKVDSSAAQMRAVMDDAAGMLFFLLWSVVTHLCFSGLF